MEKRRFHAIPLTPVHIGTGDVMTAEEFYTDRNEMVRFHPGLVLQAMSAPDRNKYESLIDRGDIGGAWRQMRTAARATPRARLYSVGMGSTAKREMEGILGKLDKRIGEVRPMPRHPHDGHVVIPGSAIKGAIRTAVLNGYIREDERTRARWSDRVRQSDFRDLKRLHGDLEKEVLRGPGGKIDNDPFRLIHVGDSTVAQDQVRVDRLTLVKPDGDPLNQKGPQMYAERLMSMADGKPPSGFTVEIGIDTRKARHREVGKLVPRLPDWEFLSRSCNSFFRGRYDAENDKFTNLYGAVPAKWWKQVEDRDGVLLRIGRFSHFESLSVDHLRRGENRVTRAPIFGMGSSRTVCEIEVQNRRAVFGWLALLPQ